MGADAGGKPTALDVPDPLRTYKMLVAGGMGGAVSRTCTAPLDRLRMLLQVNSTREGLTLAQGFRQMAGEGTVRAFFRGNGANVAKIAPETAGKFAIYDAYKRKFLSHKRPEEIAWYERLVGGAVSGGLAQTAVYPFETVRTRLAVSPEGTYKGIGHCISTIWQKEGFGKLYSGVKPSVAGILPYAGVDMAVFETAKGHLMANYYPDGPMPVHATLLTGVLASSVAQFVSYPLYLARTRMQAEGIAGGPRYNGVADLFTQVVRDEGLRGLFKGITPNLIKLAPAAGISWLVVEKTKEFLGISARS